MYHIHVDSMKSLTEALSERLEEIGFFETNFSGHPEGREHFEPVDHWTFKTDDQIAVDRVKAQATTILAEAPDFKGYLECEQVAEFPSLCSPVTGVIQAPDWRLNHTTLDQIGQSFRQAEIYLTVSASSNEEVQEHLLDSGLFGAYMEKADRGKVLILTAQGMAPDIGDLNRRVISYVQKTPGIIDPRLKYETAIGYRLFGVVPAQLPKIVKEVVVA